MGGWMPCRHVFLSVSLTPLLPISHPAPDCSIMKRKIVYHGGPTNSGKTYHALQRLKAADPLHGGGVYLGPLRLLALEVYDRLNEEGEWRERACVHEGERERGSACVSAWRGLRALSIRSLEWLGWKGSVGRHGA